MKKLDIKKELVIITYIVIIIIALLNVGHIWNFIESVFKLFNPLWIGILLAIIINVPMSNLEKKYFHESSTTTRILSIIISLLLFIIIIYLFVFLIIPDFINSISNLINKLPTIVETIKEYILNHSDNKTLTLIVDNITEQINGINKTKMINDIASQSISFLSNVFSTTFNIITGLFISIYLLMSKEKFIEGTKKIIKASVNKKTDNKINDYLVISSKILNKFISSQCLECLILGAIFFIVLSIFRFPYALSISFLICITAIIPIFGATIACVIGAILIATVSLKSAIFFIIIFLIIQQIENNFIYPKIVGKNVGLPAIITMLAVIIGGKLFGFIGMVICVPLTSILYTIISTEVDKKLSKYD